MVKAAGVHAAAISMRPIIQNGDFNVLVGIQVEKLWITRVWSCLASCRVERGKTYRLGVDRCIGGMPSAPTVFLNIL